MGIIFLADSSYSQAIKKLIPFFSMEISHPWQATPFTETKFFKQPDACHIVTKKYGYQCFKIVEGCDFQGMIHEL
jgi:hypothetical protein